MPLETVRSVDGGRGGDNERWGRTGCRCETEAWLKNKGFIRLQDRLQRRIGLETCSGKLARCGFTATQVTISMLPAGEGEACGGFGYKSFIEKEIDNINYAGLPCFTDVGPIGTDYPAIEGDPDLQLAARQCEKNSGYQWESKRKRWMVLHSQLPVKEK